MKPSIYIPRGRLLPPKFGTYDDEEFDPTIKGLFVRPFPPPVFYILRLSSQAISNCSRIFLDFVSIYGPLDRHEAAVDQRVSTIYHLPPSLSRSSLYFGANG